MNSVSPDICMCWMSPGRAGAIVIWPPLGAENVLRKKLSPPRTERFRPPRRPPFDFVSISTPGDMLTMQPDSAWTASPAESVTIASE